MSGIEGPGIIGGGSGDADATYITTTDQTSDLPNSRELVAGTGITLDATTPGELTINATPVSSAFSGARVYRSTGAGNQAIPESVFTPIVFDTEDFDVGGYWSAGNPSRLTAPAAGYYFVEAGWFGNNDFEAYIISNGVTAVRKAVAISAPNGPGQVSGIFQLDIGDYVEVDVFVGGDSNITPINELVNFQISRLGI